MKKDLQILINRHKNHFTVIITFYALLEDYYESLIKRKTSKGLTSSELRNRYNKIASNYKKKDFAASYVQRHSKTGDLFNEREGYYQIRKELLDDLTEKNIEVILLEIKDGYDSYSKKRKEIIKKIRALEKENDFEKIKLGVNDLMDFKLYNKGQLFEIISFSILYNYFKIFGFSLRRFSTTFSNDGGMDFIAEDCIYQVTTSPTVRKIESDIKKLPGISRVLVIPEIGKSLSLKLSKESLIKNVITKKDVLNHFLKIVSTQKYKKSLFATIEYEIEREV